MAGVNFKVDAVLGDTSKLQQQINNLRTNLNLTINNTQALRAVGDVQRQFEQVKTVNNDIVSITEKIKNGYQEITTTLTKNDDIIVTTKDNYAKLQQDIDSFNKKNLNAIDFEIQKREEASKRFSAQIKAQMEEEVKSQNANFKQQLSLTKEIENLRSRTQTSTPAEQAAIQAEIQRKESLLQQLQIQTQLTQAQQQEIAGIQQKADFERRIINIKKQQLNESYGSLKGKDLFGVNSDELVKQTKWFKDLNAQYNNTATIVKSVKSSTNQYGESLSQCTVRVKNAKNQWETYNATINNTTGQLRVIKGQTSDVINSQMNLNSMLKSAIERFAVWGIAMKMWTGLGNIVSDCTSYIKDLDGAMTNIRIVTMGTKEATEDLFKTYNQMGQELGRTTLDVADSADTWLRQGYTIQETNELIRDSMILSTLGQIDSADATTYLTSAMKGYKVATEDVINIVDKFVAVDLVAATSAGDLATALSRTANMARTTGVEMDKMIAIIATVQEVTQQSAEVVGNAFKTILSRMSNVKLARLVDPESGEALNDVETTLASMGIKLRDTNNEWRNFGDVLDEVGEKWQRGEFSDTQKSALATAFAGTRQKENFLTLMENYQNVEKYATEAFESAGLAEEKYGIYTESVAGKQATLTDKVEEFYTNILNSDFIKKLLDIGSGFMDMMNSADGLTGKVIVLTGVFIGLSVVLKALKTTTLFTQFISLLSTFQALTVGAVTLNGAFLSLGTQGIGGLLFAIPKAIIGLISLTANFGFAEVSALGLKGALDLLNINPVMLAISALIAVVAGGIAIFKHFNVTLEEQHEKAQQAQSDYEEVKNELQSVNDELKTTKQRIAELEAKDSLTFVEKEELENLKATNAELEKRQYWLDLEAEQKKKTATEEAKKAWDKDFGKNEYFSRYQTHQDAVVDQYGNPTGQTQTVYNQIDEEQYIKEQIKYLGELDASIQKVVKSEGEWANASEEDKSKEWERLDKERTAVQNYLESVGARIQTDFLDAYDVDDATKKEWTDLQDIIRSALDPEYSVGKFKDAVEELPEVIKNNIQKSDKAGNFKNLEEVFTIDDKLNTQQLEKFKTLLDELGISADDATKYFNSLKESVYDSLAVTPLISYGDAINAVKDKAKTLADAQKEMSDSGYLTYNTVSELSKEFEDLDQYLTLTANGYTISKSGLDALNSSMTTTYEVALNDAKTAAMNILEQEGVKADSYAHTTEEIIKQLKAQLALAQVATSNAQADYTALGIGGSGLKDYEPYTDALAKEQNIQNAITNLENSQKNLDRVKKTINSITTTEKSKGSSSSKKTSDALKELKESIEDLERPADIIDKKIKAMGDIDTVSEMNNQYDLLSQKLQIVNKNLSIVQNKLNNKNLTKEQREYLEDKMYEYQAEIASIQDSLDDIRLDKLKEQLEDLQKPIDYVDNKIKRLGDINTVQEKAKESELLAQKFRLVSNNIATINKLLKDTTLSQDMRDLLNEELQNLIVEQVSIRDDIESNVRDAVELEKENAQLQAELNYKQQLYELELKLYGDTGKELYEHQQEEEIKRLQEIIDARNDEKDIQDKIAEEQEYQNKLLEAKINLQNALNNKTVKILTKQEDGTWQYEYSANMSDVKEAQDELADIQKEYDDWKYEQETDRIQQEIDAIQKEVDEKSEMYDDMEFHLNQSLEKQTNAIEQYYADIDKITQDRMAQYQKTYGDAWDKVIGIAQSRLDTLTALNTQLQGQSEYAFEVIGSDNTYVKKVQSFDVGGKIQGSGLAFVHNKERVLTAEQNAYFEQFVTKLPSLIKAIDITKFNGYSGIQSSSIKEKFDKTVQTIISKVECVFPNITTTDGLQQAILELPRLALQKS